MRTITARFASKCPTCSEPIAQGDTIHYHGRAHATHTTCAPAEGMPTTRERREARADKLREWADKREAKAEAGFDKAHKMADAIPFGQPILVGHYSEGRDRRYRDRIETTAFRAVDDLRTAERMRSKADNIETAADRAIYDDDPDAIERLTDKLADLEAQRARWVAFNKATRKAKQATAETLALLDAKQRADYATCVRIGHGIKSDGTVWPYHTANLGGLISTTRNRLARLTRERSA